MVTTQVKFVIYFFLQASTHDATDMKCYKRRGLTPLSDAAIQISCRPAVASHTQGRLTPVSLRRFGLSGTFKHVHQVLVHGGQRPVLKWRSTSQWQPPPGLQGCEAASPGGQHIACTGLTTNGVGSGVMGKGKRGRRRRWRDARWREWRRRRRRRGRDARWRMWRRGREEIMITEKEIGRDFLLGSECVPEPCPDSNLERKGSTILCFRHSPQNTM